MGIYEQSYRRFEGKLHGWLGRVFTIFKNEFIRRLKNKWILILLILSWAFGVLPILFGAPYFAYFIFSFIWLLFFTTVVGGPILAEDFQYNTVTLYLSRPLKRFDYFLGKYLTLFALISLIALIPNILLSFYIIGVQYDTPSGNLDYYRFSYSFIGIGVLMTFVFTNIGMAFSVMTNNYANLLRVFSAWNGISDNSFVVMDADISLSILGFISLICLLLVWIKIRRVELSE
jgi:ABC-type transport system involved in multi-copper enzyme maturation permease subunit